MVELAIAGVSFVALVRWVRRGRRVVAAHDRLGRLAPPAPALTASTSTSVYELAAAAVLGGPLCGCVAGGDPLRVVQASLGVVGLLCTTCGRPRRRLPPAPTSVPGRGTPRDG